MEDPWPSRHLCTVLFRFEIRQLTTKTYIEFQAIIEKTLSRKCLADIF